MKPQNICPTWVLVFSEDDTYYAVPTEGSMVVVEDDETTIHPSDGSGEERTFNNRAFVGLMPFEAFVNDYIQG